MVKHISIIKKAVNEKYKGDPEKIGNWMGKFTAARRFRLTKRWHEDPHCHYCRKELVKPGNKSPKNLAPTYDHKIPQDIDGSEAYENCVLCCKSCNSLKGNIDYIDFINKIEEFKTIKLYKRSLAILREKKHRELAKVKKSKLQYTTYIIALMCFDKNIKEIINEISC